jgi:multidrug resistance efflux pump
MYIFLESSTPKKGKNIIKKIKDNPKAQAAIVLVLLIIIVSGLAYWQEDSRKIYIEKSGISAPIISLIPANAGVLDRVLVKEGDKVSRNKVLAYMTDGSELRAGTNGLVIYVNNVPGQTFSPLMGTPVIKMIDPSELRVVGRIAEDKGLASIKEGQKVFFTVDAFPGKEYTGVVDLLVPTSKDSDIVFSISDKREEKEFEVKVKYDIYAYPELKNGMSAKMWIYKE